MEDIRIMRQTQCRGQQYTVTVTSQIVAPYNPKRVALIFSAGAAATVINLIYGNPDNANVPITLVGQGGPMLINLQQHGVACLGPWWAASGAGGGLSVLEVFLEKE